jgi:hypothetical protein
MVRPMARTRTPKKMPPPPRRLLGVWDGFWVLALIALWLLPIFYVGSFRKDVRALPIYLRYQQRIACLFTGAVGNWSTYHVEIRREGETGFVELPEAGYFDMEIFGYRTRMHRILGFSRNRPRGGRRQREIAEYLHARHRELDATQGAIEELRFVRAWHPVAVLAQEKGCFVKPALAEVPPNRQRAFGHFRLDAEGRAAALPIPGEPAPPGRRR